MKRASLTLILRLVALQVAVHSVTFSLTAAFAPRVLLLDSETSSASLSVVGVVGVLSCLFSVVATFAITRRLRPALRSLSLDAASPSPADVLALYAVPARLAIASAAFSIVVACAHLLPELRPQVLDTYTALALVLLVVTMVSTAALPAYVAMRASMARALELAPPRAAHEALRSLGRGALGRVRKRFVASVAAPVAFVALGASLLVDAHVRSFDRDARITDATDFARSAFDPIEQSATHDGTSRTGPIVEDKRGRTEVVEAAATLGFRVHIDPSYRGVWTVRRGDEGETQVRVPMESGAALVRFGTPNLSRVTAFYVVLALCAIGLAALLGMQIAGAFESDVALATREMSRAGTGESRFHEARFTSMRALLQAVGSLSGVFREFAGAQERSIEAREATERMRGLLLASMSHDLKAPLNSVLGFAELVGRNPLSDPQKESLSIIAQRGRELLMLIDTILDSARVEAGELEVSAAATNVSDVVMSSVLEARDLAVGTAVTVQAEIQSDLPSILIDGTRIVQALTAVVMTAVRFTDKGVVPVRATLPDTGTRLQIEVETSGEGLPVGEREKIFDAFKSAESARRHGSLGLGLQLARSIFEIHGGTIEVEHTDGGGMGFRILLPVHNDRASIRVRATKPMRPGG